MLKVHGVYEIVRSGEWKQSIEIIDDGQRIGFVDHERTRSGTFTTTRNIHGESREGECLEWLAAQ